MALSIQHPSLLLAEQLNLEDIWMYNHPENPSLSSRFCDASANLERLICRPPARSILAARLDTIANEFEACAVQFSARESYRSRAVLVNMPLFERRAQREDYEPGLISQIYRNLGNLATQTPFAEDSNARGAFYEIVGSALGAYHRRQSHLVFPGLVREEAATKIAGETDNFNHDGYTIEAASKIAVQFKGSKRAASCKKKNKDYNEAILRFHVRDNICLVAKKIPMILPDVDLTAINTRRPPQGIAGQLLAITAELIGRHSAGEGLTRVESLFMDNLANQLAKAIGRHATKSFNKTPAVTYDPSFMESAG